VKPDRCRRCDRKLCGHDPAPLRASGVDLPRSSPRQPKYQRHRLTCTCGTTTCAPLPAGVPRGQAGPRLIALVTPLDGLLPSEQAASGSVSGTVLNQPCSPGWVIKLQNLRDRGLAALL